MTSIDAFSAFTHETPKRLAVGDFKQLNVDLTTVKRLPDSMHVDMERLQELQYTRHIMPPDEVYAEVKVGGKVVATLYNSGAMMTDNSMGSQLQNLPSVRDSLQVGPALAQERAEEIARVLGGRIDHADSQLSQAQWQELPKPYAYVDYEAMRRDQGIASRNVEGNALMAAHLLAAQDAA